MVPIDALEAVTRIDLGGTVGSCFTLAVDDRQYLVTARHLLPGPVADGQPLAQARLWLFDRWHAIHARVIGCGRSGTPDDDYLVLACPERIGAFSLSANHGGFAISQDVYFAGYPYNSMTDGFFRQNLAYPFVKKAIISGVQRSAHVKPGLLVLDGHNNPGFSGGPVLVAEAGTPPRAIGVVSGFRTELIAVDGADELHVAANAGMIYATPMAPVLNAIAADPTGMPIEPGWDWHTSRFFPMAPAY